MKPLPLMQCHAMQKKKFPLKVVNSGFCKTEYHTRRLTKANTYTNLMLVSQVNTLFKIPSQLPYFPNKTGYNIMELHSLSLRHFVKQLVVFLSATS